MTKEPDTTRGQNTPETSVHAQPAYAAGPKDVPAAGNDPDSRLRELKMQLARAEATGDTDGADELRRQMDTVRSGAPAEKAAAARRNAAKGDPAARTRAPQGRTPTPPAQGQTTTSAATGTPATKDTPATGSPAGKDTPPAKGQTTTGAGTAAGKDK